MKMTERESQIYNYFVKYMQEHLYAPNLKSTSSAASYLTRLEAKGLIEIRLESPRAIRLAGYSIVPNIFIEELNRLRTDKGGA